jgi:hypothetical protein
MAQRWSGGIAPPIPNLSTKWRCVVNFMPQLLYPWEGIPWCPLNIRLGGHQGWPKTFWRKQKYLALSRVRTLGRAASNLVTRVTELSQLLSV